MELDEMFDKQVINMLQKVQSTFNNSAIIAGGACRDTILGGVIKDYDIYVPVKAHKKFNILLENEGDEIFGLACGDGIEQLSSTSSAVAYPKAPNKTGPHGVWDILKDGYRFNIMTITCDPVTFLKDNFDINICEAWTHDGDEIEVSDQFKAGVGMKEIKVKTQYRDSRKTAIRVVCLTTKYPQFAFKGHIYSVN